MLEPTVPVRRRSAAACVRAGAALLSLSVALALPELAGAATLTGQGTDATGDDSNSPSVPSRDLRALTATFDESGSASATVTVGGAATSDADDALIQVVFGTKSGSDCGAPALAVRAAATGANPAWALSSDAEGTSEPAGVTARGASITLTASSPRIAALRPNCAWALAGSRTPPAKLFDTLAPIALADPSAPPPPSTPADPPSTPGPVDPPAIPVPGAANKAALAIAVDRTPSGKVRRGGALTFKATVRNVGSAEARGVQVKLAGARGVSASTKAFTAKTLAPGAALQKTVKVKLSSRAKTTSTSTWKASADGGLAASAPLRLKVGQKLTPVDAGLAPLGRTYWRTDTVQAKSEYSGYRFVNERFAWRGLGTPENCKSRTAKTETGPGCVPYAFNAKTGTLTLDGKPASIENGQLKIPDPKGGLTKIFWPTEPVAAGTRMTASLEAVTVLGNCVAISLNPSCSIVRRYLRLLPDGQYSLTSKSTTTSGGVGSLPFIAINGAKPEEKGLYEVLPGSILRLTPMTGAVETFPLSVQIEDGRADPATTGLLLAASDFNP